jgi:hypothetical protein
MPKSINPHLLRTTGPKAARALFTDRVAETERFQELLTAPAGAPRPLLMFYGVGGAGKTRLLDHLAQHCEAQTIPWATVDLSEKGGADEALPAFAAQLTQRHDLTFAGFRRVLAALRARQQGGGPSRRAGDQETGGGATAGRVSDLVLDALGLVPAVGQLAAVVKLAKGASQVAFKQAMRKKEFCNAVLSLGSEGELIELVEWSTEQLKAELQRRFAAELSVALTEKAGAVRPAALIFDTHEALWQDTKGGAATEDAWIRLLRQYLHESRVLMVVVGRDRLCWPEDWDEADAQGRRLWLEQHVLGGLSALDARAFLHKADAADGEAEPAAMPEPLLDAILRVTNEQPDANRPSQHHCFLLALCTEVVASTRTTTGQYPPPEAFAGIPRGDAAAEPLVHRFLSSLHNEQMVDWLEELSLTPRFDEDCALALDAARRHYNARAGWERLLQLSLLEEWEGGFLEMHLLLCDTLRARVVPRRAQSVHAWAATYWAELAGESDWQRRGLAWYHRRFVDHAAALAEYRALMHEAEQCANVPALRALGDWWRDVDVPIPCVNEAQARDLVLRGELLRRLPTGDSTANLQRAIAGYEAALQVLTKTEFPADWAAVQHELGGAYWSLPTGDRTANVTRAIACYEAALRVRTEVGSPVEWAMTQNNLGAAYAELPSGDPTENLGVRSPALRPRCACAPRRRVRPIGR